jgi:Glycosyltransferase family 87
MMLPPAIIRLARIVAMAVIIGVGISELWFAVTGWTQSDATAYLHAAQRLREGQPLYPVVSDVEASDVYRYAPWFAWLAVPFTFLPVQVAGAMWSGVLVGASVLAVVPLARQQAWLQVAFFFPILIGISAYGNVQALMIAPLAWFIGRRSGPLWVGIAASLKIFPILFLLTYLGRREWLKAIVSMGVAGLLWAPVLFVDMRGYVTDVGQAGLFGSAAVHYIIAGMCLVGAVILARMRYAWLSSAVAVILVASRFFIYDLTYLLAATPEGRSEERTAG